MSGKKLIQFKAVTDGNRVILNHKVLSFLFNCFGDIVLEIIKTHTQNNDAFDLKQVIKIMCNNMEITDCIGYSITEIDNIGCNILFSVINNTIKTINNISEQSKKISLK